MCSPSSANVATFQRRDIMTSPGLNQQDFLRYNKRTRKIRGRRNEIQDGDDYTGVTGEIM